MKREVSRMEGHSASGEHTTSRHASKTMTITVELHSSKLQSQAASTFNSEDPIHAARPIDEIA